MQEAYKSALHLSHMVTKTLENHGIALGDKQMDLISHLEEWMNKFENLPKQKVGNQMIALAKCGFTVKWDHRRGKKDMGMSYIAHYTCALVNEVINAIRSTKIELSTVNEYAHACREGQEQWKELFAMALTVYKNDIVEQHIDNLKASLDAIDGGQYNAVRLSYDAFMYSPSGEKNRSPNKWTAQLAIQQALQVFYFLTMSNIIIR